MAEVFITCEFNSSLRDLETSSDVTTVHGNFLSNKADSFLFENVDVFQTSFQDSQNLAVVVGLVDQPVVTNTGCNLSLHALW